MTERAAATFERDEEAKRLRAGQPNATNNFADRFLRFGYLRGHALFDRDLSGDLCRSDANRAHNSILRHLFS